MIYITSVFLSIHIYMRCLIWWSERNVYNVLRRFFSIQHARLSFRVSVLYSAELCSEQGAIVWCFWSIIYLKVLVSCLGRIFKVFHIHTISWFSSSEHLPPTDSTHVNRVFTIISVHFWLYLWSKKNWLSRKTPIYIWQEKSGPHLLYQYQPRFYLPYCMSILSAFALK